MTPAEAAAEQERIKAQQWAAERAGDEARRQAMLERQEREKRSRVIEQSRGFVGKFKDRIHQYNEKRDARSIENMERKTTEALERSNRLQRHVTAREGYVKARSEEIDLIHRKKNAQNTLREYEREHPTTLTGKFVKGARTAAKEAGSMKNELNQYSRESGFHGSSARPRPRFNTPKSEYEYRESNSFTSNIIGSFANISTHQQLPAQRQQRQAARRIEQQPSSLYLGHMNMLTNFSQPRPVSKPQKSPPRRSSNHLNMLTNTANFGFSTKRKRSNWGF